MKTLWLITKDAGLKKEITAVLPKGFKIKTLNSGKADALQHQLILYDMDSLGTGRLEETSKANFVICVTKQKRTGPVIEATTFGAYEVLHRPLKRDIVFQVLEEVQGIIKELGDFIDITKDTLVPAATCAIVGYSHPIMDVCKKLAQAAKAEVPVLITGETGTGKELIAEAIAQLSPRFGKPFEVINCAAIPENLLESELFGYEKGAFTGAAVAKEGRLKVADDGCVFLDEVGELPLSLQGKFLRFLQSQTFHPIGSTKEAQVNVRVIAATNKNLPLMVREGKFRADLYHRLAVVKIHVPPLRERREDIPALVQCLLYRHSHLSQKPVKGITKAFLNRLLSYGWHGNIRELENVIRSAIATARTPYLTTQELKELGSAPVAKESEQKEFTEELGAALIPFLKEALKKKQKNIYERVLNEMDKVLLDYILSRTNENQSEAARLLGISRLTLRKKLGQ